MARDGGAQVITWLRGPRARVFVLTYLAYAFYYLSRKPFSVAKTTLGELGVSLRELSAIDTGYLAMYAVGQFAWGIATDRFGARRVLVFGMTAVALFTLLFGLSSNALWFAITFAALGLVQATGWSSTVRAMTPWFGSAERGRVMGPWSTCYQVGGLVATALAGWVLGHYGWRATFYVPAALTLGFALLLAIALPPPPVEAATPTASPTSPTHAVGPARSPWREPLLWTLGGSYFVLKLVRYTMLFWLPYFLTTRFAVPKDQAGNYSLAFEAGGIFGTYAIGAISDRVRRRGVLAMIMLVGLTITMQQLAAVDDLTLFTFGAAACGFFLFGPDALISGIAAQDIGGARGVGRAAGIINGIGALGGFCQGLVTVYVVEHWGWSALFTAFGGACAIATLLLIPYARRVRAVD